LFNPNACAHVGVIVIVIVIAHAIAAIARPNASDLDFSSSSSSRPRPIDSRARRAVTVPVVALARDLARDARATTRLVVVVVVGIVVGIARRPPSSEDVPARGSSWVRFPRRVTTHHESHTPPASHVSHVSPPHDES
jgi:hypothetical protein